MHLHSAMIVINLFESSWNDIIIMNSLQDVVNFYNKRDFIYMYNNTSKCWLIERSDCRKRVGMVCEIKATNI